MVIYSPDIFASQRFGGISRCIVEIAAASKRAGGDVKLFAGRTANVYALDLVKSPSWDGDLVIERTRECPGRILGGLKQEELFANFVRMYDAKVVHRSYYSIRDKLPRSVRIVETLHDMMWERLFANMGAKERVNSWLKYRALRRADAIACVSEFTRSELTAVWPELADKCVVIPHGVRKLSTHDVASAHRKSHFLYVGSREPRKNFPVLIQAIARADVDPAIKVVCVGGGPFKPSEQAMFESAKVADRFEQVSGGDDLLAGLYASSIALLYPSNYEGFGMPLLEAMIHDCPVICSRSSSLPEVGGRAVVFADGANGEQWAAEMERLASNPQARRILVDIGQEHVRNYSWDVVGQKYRELYNSL